MSATMFRLGNALPFHNGLITPIDTDTMNAACVPMTATAVAFTSSTTFPLITNRQLIRKSFSKRCRQHNTITTTVIRRATIVSQEEGQDDSQLPSTPIEDILQSLKRDGEPSQTIALISLSQLPGDQALSILQQSDTLNSKFRKTRIAALDALGKTRIKTECSYIVEIIQSDSDHSIRAAAAAALSNLLSTQDRLDGDLQPRGALVATQGELGLRTEQHFIEATKALRHAVIMDDHFIVRYSAIVALGNLEDINAVPLLLSLIESAATAPLEVASAIDAMGEIVPATDVESKWLFVIKSRASDKDDLIRASVVRTFARWRSIAGVPDMLATMLYEEIKYGRSSFVLGLLQYIIGTDMTT